MYRTREVVFRSEREFFFGYLIPYENSLSTSFLHHPHYGKKYYEYDKYSHGIIVVDNNIFQPNLEYITVFYIPKFRVSKVCYHP